MNAHKQLNSDLGRNEIALTLSYMEVHQIKTALAIYRNTLAADSSELARTNRKLYALCFGVTDTLAQVLHEVI